MTTDSEPSDPNEVKDELHHEQKLVRVFALGRKIRPSMMRYTEKELDQLDIRLLRGFYVQD